MAKKAVKEKILLVNSVFLGLVLLVHALRVLFGWSVQVADWNVPLWVSALAIVVLGILLYANIKALRD